MDKIQLYSPLPSNRSIRFLVLDAGTRDDELVGTLLTDSLDDPVCKDFVALSYVWGNPSPPATVTLNGISGKEITPNLAAALHHIRHPDVGITLWIDALCIHQEDINERGQQVSLMGEIYSAASSTIIWLGEDREDTSLGFDILRKANAQSESEGDSIETENFNAKLNAQRGFPDSGDEAWLSVSDIFGRPWFRRVWVIQEFSLSQSPKFILGKHEMNWLEFGQAATWLFGHGYANVLLPECCVGLGYTILLLCCRPTENETRWPLLGLLDDVRSFHATDPRDKVFGVLGLSEEGSEIDKCKLLTPDYNKTIAEVLSDATTHFLQCNHDGDENSGSLEVLSGVKHASEYDYEDGFPSWVPRWDVEEQGTPVGYSKYQACGDSHPRFGAPYSTREIVLGGFKVGTVTSVPQGWKQNAVDVFEDTVQWNRISHIWTQHIYKFREKHGGLEKLALMFTQTITTGGCIEHTPGRPNLSDFVAYIREHGGEDESESIQSLRLLQPNILDKPPPNLQDQGQEISMPTQGEKTSAGVADRVVVTNHCFFLVDEHRMANGPFTVCEDDIVCILYGGNVPFVLRPEEDHYTLVGECFIYGLMDGEALKEKEDRGIKDEWFRLL